MKSLPVIVTPPRTRGGDPGAEPAAAASVQSGPLQTEGMVNDAEKSAALKPAVIDALRTVFDPEISVNVYDLGLIYDVIVDASGAVGIRMTLTAPACPAAQFLPAQVKNAAAAVAGVADARVDVVWDPPWDRDRMSEAAKLQLGLF